MNGLIEICLDTHIIFGCQGNNRQRNEMKSILKLYPTTKKKHASKHDTKMEHHNRKESRVRNESHNEHNNINDNNNNINNSNLDTDRNILGRTNPGYEGDNDETGGFPNTPPGYEKEDSYEEEQDDFIRVPSCMLGKPLKDFHSGQDNVSVLFFPSFNA